MSRVGLSYDECRKTWVGMIALAGVAAERGVVRLVYLDEAYERRVREGRMTTAHDLREAIIEGTVQRVRPKVMTVIAVMGPDSFARGGGSDKGKGLVSSAS
ncbi:MAG: hypothetical protein NDI90_02660 [Nitrospira sp. BO4]|jgi:Cu(I)/Ag(I) efflux system membrane protein CusA/SilA|nr:hypothetical protein [Nitrospira sp. BO4]